MTVRVLDSGDAAFTVEFGDRIDPAMLAAVRALDTEIARLQTAGGMPGLIETMPTFRSLTLFFDPLLTGRSALIEALQPILLIAEHAAPVPGRRWRLPVCYEGDAGPDLAEIARAAALSVEDVINLHSTTEVNVYMLGFLPGCSFMGDVASQLNLPRRSQPRVRVPAGSVAIAGGLTAIYPWESPGGWHLLGRCPVPLFDANRTAPALLGVGDRVCFEPVRMAEFERLAVAIRAGEIDPAIWQTDAAASVAIAKSP
ncbi:MAG: 5-oxoprolinase subunit PxpB [Ideonella sp.]